MPNCIVGHETNFVAFSKTLPVKVLGEDHHQHLEILRNENSPGLSTDLLTRTCILTSSAGDSYALESEFEKLKSKMKLGLTSHGLSLK